MKIYIQYRPYRFVHLWFFGSGWIVADLSAAFECPAAFVFYFVRLRFLFLTRISLFPQRSFGHTLSYW